MTLRKPMFYKKIYEVCLVRSTYTERNPVSESGHSMFSKSKTMKCIKMPKKIVSENNDVVFVNIYSEIDKKYDYFVNINVFKFKN